MPMEQFPHHMCVDRQSTPLQGAPVPHRSIAPAAFMASNAAPAFRNSSPNTLK